MNLEQCDDREKARDRKENEMFCKSLIDRVVSQAFEIVRFRTLRYGHAHDRAWVDTQVKSKSVAEMPPHRKFQFDVLFASNGTWSSELSDEIARNRVKKYEMISENLETKANKCFAAAENVKLGDLVAHVTAKPLEKPKSRPFRVILCGSPFQGKSELARKIANEHDLAILNATDLVRDAFQNKEQTQIREILLSGKDVPDIEVVSLIAKHIKSLESDGRGWILDGYPETAMQAQLLKSAIQGGVEVERKEISRLFKQSADLREKGVEESVFDAIVRLDSDASNIFYRAIGASERNAHNIATNVCFDSVERDELMLWFGSVVSQIRNDGNKDSLETQVLDIVNAAKQEYDDSEKRLAHAMLVEAEAKEQRRRRFNDFHDIVGIYTYKPTQDEVESGEEEFTKTWTLRLDGTAESADGTKLEMRRLDMNTIELVSTDKSLVFMRSDDENSTTIRGLVERIVQNEEKKEEEEDDDDEQENKQDTKEKTAEEEEFLFVRISKQDPILRLDDWFLKSNASKYKIRQDCALFLKSQWSETESLFLCGLEDTYKNMFEDEIAFVSRMYVHIRCNTSVSFNSQLPYPGTTFARTL